MKREWACKSCGLAIIYEEVVGKVTLMHETPICEGYAKLLASLPPPDEVRIVVDEVPDKN